MSGPADPAEAPLPPAPPWQAWLGGAVSAVLLGAILWQLRHAGDGVGPPDLPPAAWAVFGLVYLVQPLCDFAVYRRLWGLPPAALPVLLRKTAINETVLGYSGELYLYVWARRRVGPERAPFQTVKDVAIVSALISNLITLGLLVVAATTFRELDLARAAAMSGLSILLWRLALPQVPLGAWFVLLAVRWVVSRVPFVSNKDLLFGNLVLLIAPPHAPVAVTLASLALATLATHLSVVAVLGAGDLVRAARRPAAAGWRRPRP